MEEDIFLEETYGNAMIDWLMNFDLAFLQDVITRIGENPFLAMFWFVAHGGWVVFVIMAFYAFRQLWLVRVITKAAKQKRFILLAIDVPRMSEQSVKAVENLFAHIAGAHSPVSFIDKWFNGKVQDPLSFEIISVEGHIQYIVRCLSGLRDLVEASVYAQYPDAQVTEVEDYATRIPKNWPDANMELFGTELVPVKSDVYPLKTYKDFEHQLSMEYKDPLAALLEAFSRLGPGEQAWYQIVVVPIGQKDFSVKAKKEIMAMKGEKPPVKKTWVDSVVEAPIQILSAAGDAIIGGGGDAAPKKEEKSSKIASLTPGERKVLELVEQKMSKIQFLCKIRFIYVAKKEVFSKGKILQSFIGAIKQYNSNDLQSLKPESDKVGMNGNLIFFREKRNNRRKEKIVQGFIGRSDGVGMNLFHLGTDELASLWHLPIVKNVKAPQLKKTEGKTVEPPSNLPFA